MVIKIHPITDSWNKRLDASTIEPAFAFAGVAVEVVVSGATDAIEVEAGAPVATVNMGLKSAGNVVVEVTVLLTLRNS